MHKTHTHMIKIQVDLAVCKPGPFNDGIRVLDFKQFRF